MSADVKPYIGESTHTQLLYFMIVLNISSGWIPIHDTLFATRVFYRLYDGAINAGGNKSICRRVDVPALKPIIAVSRRSKASLDRRTEVRLHN